MKHDENQMKIYDKCTDQLLGVFKTYTEEYMEEFWYNFSTKSEYSGKYLGYIGNKTFINLFLEPSLELSLNVRLKPGSEKITCFYSPSTGYYIIRFFYYCWDLNNFHSNSYDVFNEHNGYWHGDGHKLTQLHGNCFSVNDTSLSLGSIVLSGFELLDNNSSRLHTLISSIASKRTELVPISESSVRRTYYLFGIDKEAYLLVDGPLRFDYKKWKLHLYTKEGKTLTSWNIDSVKRIRNGGETTLTFKYNRGQVVTLFPKKRDFLNHIIDVILGYLAEEEGVVFSPSCFDKTANPSLSLFGEKIRLYAYDPENVRFGYLGDLGRKLIKNKTDPDIGRFPESLLPIYRDECQKNQVKNAWNPQEGVLLTRPVLPWNGLARRLSDSPLTASVIIKTIIFTLSKYNPIYFKIIDYELWSCKLPASIYKEYGNTRRASLPCI